MDEERLSDRHFQKIKEEKARWPNSEATEQENQ